MTENNNAMQDERRGDSLSRLSDIGCCNKAAAFTLPLKDTAQPENYFRAILVRDTIRNALLYGERDKANIMEYMERRYDEVMIRNYQCSRQNLLWDHRRVMRYLKNEPRTPIFVPSGKVEIGGRPFLVAPDAAFADDKTGELELVVFRIGKPTMTKKGKDNEMARTLQLYALLLYGKSLGYEKVKASFYFLRKTSDTSMWGACSQSFFGESDNVISMEYDEETEDLVKPFIAKMITGLEEADIDEKHCERCDKYDICKYQLPPMKLETEKKLKKNADVKLNEEQMEAVRFTKGVARVNAGAGSGKTSVVAKHIEYLLKEGAKQTEILAFTFMKAAADEMKERTETYMKRSLPLLQICTINSFENEIVMDNWEYLGFGKKPRIIDDIERFSRIDDLLCTHPIYEWSGKSFLHYNVTKGFGTSGALSLASNVFRAVKRGEPPHSAAPRSDISPAALNKLVDLYEVYNDTLKKDGLIDFDDQELLALRVIEEKPDYLAKKYAFKHIIMDEVQDTSAGQIEVIKALKALPTFESLLTVGDDFQSIFAFRDATPEIMINLGDYLECDVTDIPLTKNYRSTPEILDAAQKIIDLNVDKLPKTLEAVNGSGEKVTVKGFKLKKNEYQFIVDTVKDRLAKGASPEQIAIICYTKEELSSIADLLTKAGIPSMFGAPQPLLKNSRIKAVLAFARMLIDPENTKDAAIAANALAKGTLMEMGEEEAAEVMDKVYALASAIENSTSLDEKKAMFIKYIEEISLEDEAVEYFMDTIKEKEYDEILSYCRNFTKYGEGAEFRRVKDYPGVKLVTAHSGKGLEWDIVINSIDKYYSARKMSKAAVEEMRRLLFVSMTRAKKKLYVVGQFKAGTGESAVYNPFLEEVYHAVGEVYIPC